MTRIPFSLGDRVIIDGCPSVVAVITSMTLRQNGWSADVAWWNNGDLREAFVTVDRLTFVTPG